VCSRARAQVQGPIAEKLTATLGGSTSYIDKGVGVISRAHPGDGSNADVYVLGTQNISAGYSAIVTLKYTLGDNLDPIAQKTPVASVDWVGNSGLHNARAISMGKEHDLIYITGDVPGKVGTRDMLTICYSADDLHMVWMDRYSNPALTGDDVPVAIDASDNVAVAGTSAGVGTGKDFVTILYDRTTGDRLNLFRYDSGGGQSDTAAAVGQTGAYLVVTGSSPGLVAGDGRRYHTICYNTEFNTELWHADHETTLRDDFPVALKVAPKAPDGLSAVFVTGTSVPISSDATNADYHTVKYDLNASGTAPELWLAVYNNPARNGDDYAADIGQVFFDGPPELSLVYVTGTSAGTGTGRDIATIQYHDLGTSVQQDWEARFNRSFNLDEVAAHLVTSVDNTTGFADCFVTGSSQNGNTSPATWDCVSLKYNADPAGGSHPNPIWSITYPKNPLSPGGDDNSNALNILTLFYGSHPPIGKLDVFTTGSTFVSPGSAIQTIRYEETTP